jgi:hypothetical protein
MTRLLLICFSFLLFAGSLRAQSIDIDEHAFDALDAWVDWHQSGGTQGSQPPHNLGGYTRE